MLIISVLRMMFFNAPDKSHFHTTSLPFLTHCSMLKSHVRVTSTAGGIIYKNIQHSSFIFRNTSTFFMTILPCYRNNRIYLISIMMVVIILVTLTGQKFTSGKIMYLQNLFWITMEMDLLCIADVQG